MIVVAIPTPAPTAYYCAADEGYAPQPVSVVAQAICAHFGLRTSTTWAGGARTLVNLPGVTHDDAVAAARLYLDPHGIRWQVEEVTETTWLVAAGASRTTTSPTMTASPPAAAPAGAP